MLCEIFKEMDSHIRYKETSKKVRKRFRNHKPFWTEELTAAWKNMSTAEKLYLNISLFKTNQNILISFLKEKF